MILVLGGRYQGKHEFVKKNFRSFDILEFDELINDPDGVQGFIGRLSNDGNTDRTVVVANENSSGIIPDDPEEIRFREDYNRELIRISEEAEEVYRVFCGIGMKIK